MPYQFHLLMTGVLTYINLLEEQEMRWLMA